MAPSKRATVHSLRHVPVRLSKKASKPSKIIITTANAVLAEALERELSALDISAQLVDKPQKHEADLIVLTEGTNADHPILNRHWTVLRTCKMLRETEVPITLLGQNTHGDVSSITGLSGLARTLRQEWPEKTISTLEISPSSNAKQIAKALLTPFSDGYLVGGKMSALEVIDAPLPLPNAKSVSGSGNWLITGGARGVTAACTIRLAKEVGSGKFFLAGRSAIVEWPTWLPDCDDLPSLRTSLIQHAQQSGERPRLPEIDQQARALLAGREIRQTLSTLAAAGIDAQYLKLDISKRRSVQTAMAALTQAHGPITGLVHGAGVLADRQAMKKTKADLTKVFAPKVEGLLNILASIDVAALTHLGLFSSAAAVFGNPGQSDYAMANAWLNNVAEQLNTTHKHLRVKSFCWGPWAGGMVDDTLAAHFAERGIELIELQDGAEILAKHLLYGEDDVVNLLVGDRW